LVIDGNRRVAEVARELGLHENLLHKWEREDRRRMTAAGAGGPDPGGGETLSADECADPVRLRAQVAEQAKDIAFVKKPRRTLRRSIEGEPVRAHGCGVRLP
jgi:transposase